MTGPGKYDDLCTAIRQAAQEPKPISFGPTTEPSSSLNGMVRLVNEAKETTMNASVAPTGMNADSKFWQRRPPETVETSATVSVNLESKRVNLAFANSSKPLSVLVVRMDPVALDVLIKSLQVARAGL